MSYIWQENKIGSLFSEHRNLKNVNLSSPPGVSMVDGVIEQEITRNNLVCTAGKN